MDRLVSRPEVLAIVQARGGSKGLPRKNLRLLRGHPLVAYSIASGLAARSITRVIMSTDDEEIADVARQYGAEVPFMRPPELAGDDTPDFPLVRARAGLAGRSTKATCRQLVVQLRPTTPLRPRGMLDEAVRHSARRSAGRLRARRDRAQANALQNVARRRRRQPAAADGNGVRRALQHAAAKAARGLLANRPRRRHPRDDHYRRRFADRQAACCRS